MQKLQRGYSIMGESNLQTQCEVELLINEEGVKMTEKIIELNNTPESNFLWKGLGGNFDSLMQIINEFIDNSFSNFIKNDQIDIKKIFLRIEELPELKYKISIEDTGSGIEDLESAFSIGNKTSQSSSLNEHGFGMKHALAAANKENNNWKVITRTEADKEKDTYSIIEAPFHIFKQKVRKVSGNEWPGKLPTGTIIEFEVEKHWVDTITRGLKGNYQKLSSIVFILAEELGYTYGYFISQSIAPITIQYKDLTMTKTENIDVPEIKPVYKETINPGIGSTKYDLGDGDVDINYEFLQAEESNYKKYYKANMSTSGVEIRVNGRLLEKNLFTEIWGVEKHNSYNYILVRINVISNVKNRLPATTTNKGGLRQDDPKLEKIYQWIKSKLPQPKKRASLSDHETDLFNQLKDKKMKVYTPIDSSVVVDRERYAFTSVNEKIRIDLYQSLQNINTIYEGKKDKTTPQDVYQLLMYWDGLIMDNVPVDKAVLIASEHPESVQALVDVKNESTDARGKKYAIEIKTWRDEDISYPN